MIDKIIFTEEIERTSHSASVTKMQSVGSPVHVGDSAAIPPMQLKSGAQTTSQQNSKSSSGNTEKKK